VSPAIDICFIPRSSKHQHERIVFSTKASIPSAPNGSQSPSRPALVVRGKCHAAPGTECVRAPTSSIDFAQIPRMGHNKAMDHKGLYLRGSCRRINNPIEYVFLFNYLSLFLLCRPIPNVEVVVANRHVPKRPSLLLSVSLVTKRANREISKLNTCYYHCHCPAELQALQ